MCADITYIVVQGNTSELSSVAQSVGLHMYFTKFLREHLLHIFKC